MKDRIPTHVGRVRLVPVAGQANVYDMEMADDPVEVGTPLNKASLLKDATAALFGLTDAAVPDDIFSLIATERAMIASGDYTGDGTYGQANPCEITFPFAPKVVFIGSHDGVVMLVPFIAGAEKFFTGVDLGSGNRYEVAATLTNKTLSWYATNSAQAQLNRAPSTQYPINFDGIYQWIAIG